jgi:hypothetical protein
MTPKQKALELVEQFSSVLMHDEFYEDSIMCALVAVDEILKNDTIFLYVHHLDFWNEVKHEINNL